VLRQDLSGRSRDLRAARVPFVHARVVLAERPTSAKPGDEAIILADGTIEGFVGGSCAEATVRDESATALRSGEATVVRITPLAEPDQPGKRVVHNPCLSGGTLEVFLEPAVPPPLLVVVGHAPIARALGPLAAALRYEVLIYGGALPPDATAVVVASHGRGEEEALTAALASDVGYIGLVASPRRGRAVLDGLGLSDAQRARVRTPAGLDLGAGTAEEVALSILAEIVATRPTVPVGAPTQSDTARPPGRPADPVCGMTVDPGEGGFSLAHDGQVVWFCGRGCRDAFAADPAAYRSGT